MSEVSRAGVPTVVSTEFLGDRPGDGSRPGPADPSPAVSRALARARLQLFVARPAVPRAGLGAAGLTGLVLAVVPAMTATRLPESLAATATVSRTAYVLAVTAMVCGALVLVLTGVLAARTLRLGGDGSVSAVLQSVGVCASAPDELTSGQRSELVDLLRDVADQLRRLSDPAGASWVETSGALLEGHDG